jgi:hypothetical protein
MRGANEDVNIQRRMEWVTEGIEWANGREWRANEGMQEQMKECENKWMMWRRKEGMKWKEQTKGCEEKMKECE